MKPEITVLTILAAASLWAVAQNSDMNNKGPMPGGPIDGAYHQDGMNRGEMNTNSDSQYGCGMTNRWGNTNHWDNADDKMSNTNRHHWKQKIEGQDQNPPRN